MDFQMFTLLCNMVEKKIGQSSFQSELFLKKFKNEKFVSGEIKMALSIRFLAGGSYLDLSPLFGVSISHIYNILDDFLKWILSTFNFPLVELLRSKNYIALEHLANDFAEKTSGIFWGTFGSLDGLAVRIRCPNKNEVHDPGNYFCRKGFYALNVQAICDKQKRILWVYTSNKGSTHDSAAFCNSRLINLLEEVANDLYDKGLFIAADSAYGLTSYLITPYNSTEVKDDVNKARDAFNYYLSSCRIYIECAFGEVVMRWGILWRTLNFDPKKNQQIIQVAMLLHNFIIEHREYGVNTDNHYFSNFDDAHLIKEPFQDILTNKTGESPCALVTDNNEPHLGGRRSQIEVASAEKGVSLRNCFNFIVYQLMDIDVG